MANDKRIVAPGVTRMDWTHSYRLEGTKEDLIACGLAHASWFVADGEHDKYGRIARTKKMQIDGRQVETRVPSRGLAYVDIYYTDAEVEASRSRQRAAEDRANQRDMEELEQLELDEIPDSHERFRELALSSIWSIESISVARILENGLGGYRYAPETIAAFNDAIQKAGQVLAEGKTVFNPSRQAQEIANIKSRFAKADPGLQRFLGAVISSSPGDSG